MKKRAAGASAIALFICFGGVAPLRGQDGAAVGQAAYGEGRIIRTDGTKIRVSSFTLEMGAGRVAYADLPGAARPGPEALHLDLGSVDKVQVRERPTLGSVTKLFLFSGIAGGILALIASNPWGGPWKDTWPAIGAATAACAAAGAVVGLTVRRYKTVYANPASAPKPIIKLTLGPVAPRGGGLSLAMSY